MRQEVVSMLQLGRSAEKVDQQSGAFARVPRLPGDAWVSGGGTIPVPSDQFCAPGSESGPETIMDETPDDWKNIVGQALLNRNDQDAENRRLARPGPCEAG